MIYKQFIDDNNSSNSDNQLTEEQKAQIISIWMG